MVAFLLVVSTAHFATPSVGFALDVLPRKAKNKPPLDRLKY